LLDKMPNDENIIFSGFESGFVESFIIGEEKRYVKEILKKLPVLNNNIKCFETMLRVGMQLPQQFKQQHKMYYNLIYFVNVTAT